MFASRTSRFILLGTIITALHTQAADPVKRVPPPGITLVESDRQELEAGVKALGKEIEALRVSLQGKPEALALLPDVLIYHKAVDWALRYDEFFDAKQVAAAKNQLATGMQRAKELKEGKPSWTTATGLVVRGYISKIDGSVQPYGLVIPESWSPSDKTPRRLDFWMHGRGEKLSELSFLEDRAKNKGEFTPDGAFVLHLYGRYCCANKFAGEVDLFEALQNASSHYPVDHNRLVVRGFSMGGGSTWQFATHFAGAWAAAAPGAGFGESKEFLRLGVNGKPLPAPWEQTLWRWYDSTEYAANLANTTTVAYSGEIDGQKQAADIMIRFLEKEGLTIPHIIGPNTPHKYHPESKPRIEELVTAAAVKGRDVQALKGQWITYTLIYPNSGNPAAPTVTGMEKEWERAEIIWDRSVAPAKVDTTNITSFEWTPGAAGKVEVDGQALEIKQPAGNATGLSFSKNDGKWSVATKGVVASSASPELHKKPGVCGPIDHAFMSSFVMVRPTGKALNETVGAWAKGELAHATEFWRRVFRGDAPIKDDSALTAADIANSNLVLWGDPSSNAVLARIIAKLPIKWSATKIEFGGQTYDAANHAPVLIFPNPLNPQKYVVVNSGVTFRDDALFNNANQLAKLPDWAIIDLRTAPDAFNPGLVEAAGFFNEKWQFAGATK